MIRVVTTLGTIVVVFLATPYARGQVDFLFSFHEAETAGFNAAGQTVIDQSSGSRTVGDGVEALLVSYNADLVMDAHSSQADDNTLTSTRSDFTPDDAFATSEHDLISNVILELLLAVGFQTGVMQNEIILTSNGRGATAEFVAFDGHIEEAATGSVVTAIGSRVVPAVNGPYIPDPSALASGGGNPVPLYSLYTWTDGRSGSHVDTNVFVPPDALMINSESPVSAGFDLRTVNGSTTSIFQDVNYTNMVPEPSALFCLGLVACVGMSYRRWQLWRMSLQASANQPPGFTGEHDLG